MPREVSAGAVVFYLNNSGPEYLLLHYELGHWEFAKGHIEKDEDERETVRREVAEETGIAEMTFVEGFRESIEYYFRWQGKSIFKIVVFYLVRTPTKEVRLSNEHIGYEWLSYDEAMMRLKFKNSKHVLEKANGAILGLKR